VDGFGNVPLIKLEIGPVALPGKLYVRSVRKVSRWYCRRCRRCRHKILKIELWRIGGDNIRTLLAGEGIGILRRARVLQDHDGAIGHDLGHLSLHTKDEVVVDQVITLRAAVESENGVFNIVVKPELSA